MDSELSFSEVYQSHFEAVCAPERVLEGEQQEQLPFRLTGAQRKTAYCIRQNVEKMLRGNARQHLEWRKMPDGKSKRVWVCREPVCLKSAAFLTLTVGDNETLLDGSKHFEQIWDAKEANRRINNLARRVLRELFDRWVIVTERHKSGAIHFHLVGVLKCKTDIRTGFDFEAVKSGDYESACPRLKLIWKRLRAVSEGGQGVLESYGFGRSQLTPIEKTGEQIASYVSKYIEKNLFNRRAEDKRKKLVRYGGWNGTQLKPNDFSWGNEKARQWRYRSRICGAILGVLEREGMKEVLGPRWAFACHKVIQWQETWPVPFWEMSDYEFGIFAAEVKSKARDFYERGRAAEVQSCRLHNECENRIYGSRQPERTNYERGVLTQDEADEVLAGFPA